MNAVRSFLAIAALAMTSTAFAAPIYKYEIDNPPGSADAGDVTNVTTTYDVGNEYFTWSYSIKEKSPGVFSDGFWLVVSDGPNPKGVDDQLAIIYGDIADNILSVYAYNGANNNKSYNVGSQLARQTGAITTSVSGDEQTASFGLDVSGINALNVSADWEGIQFGTTVGIWFHPSAGSNFVYNDNDELDSYTYSSQGWYDTRDRITTEVPEPSTAALLLLGLAGLAFARRRQA